MLNYTLKSNFGVFDAPTDHIYSLYDNQTIPIRTVCFKHFDWLKYKLNGKGKPIKFLLKLNSPYVQGKEIEEYYVAYLKYLGAFKDCIDHGFCEYVDDVGKTNRYFGFTIDPYTYNFTKLILLGSLLRNISQFPDIGAIFKYLCDNYPKVPRLKLLVLSHLRFDNPIPKHHYGHSVFASDPTIDNAKLKLTNPFKGEFVNIGCVKDINRVTAEAPLRMYFNPNCVGSYSCLHLFKLEKLDEYVQLIRGKKNAK